MGLWMGQGIVIIVGSFLYSNLITQNVIVIENTSELV